MHATLEIPFRFIISSNTSPNRITKLPLPGLSSSHRKIEGGGAVTKILTKKDGEGQGHLGDRCECGGGVGGAAQFNISVADGRPRFCQSPTHSRTPDTCRNARAGTRRFCSGVHLMVY